MKCIKEWVLNSPDQESDKDKDPPVEPLKE